MSESAQQSSSSKQPASTHETPKAEVKPSKEDRYRYSKMPERIVGVTIEGGKTRILIGTGSRYGIEPGMRGYHMLTKKEFVIDRVQETGCSALIDLPIEAVQKPSTIVFIHPKSQKS
jgi:hypothetical protein